MSQEIGKMAQRTSEDLTVDGQCVTREVTLTATPISRKLQLIGQQILASGGLFEVQEDILSTCKEPIEKLGDRLIRARDMGIALVELTMFPKDGSYDALSQLFGVNGRLALSIMRADGIEQNDDFHGNHMSFERVGLSIPTVHVISLDGNYGSEVSSVLTTESYCDYDDQRSKYARGPISPKFSATYYYEDRYADINRMDTTLNQTLEDYKLAVKQEAAVDGIIVDEVPAERQLTAGNN